MDIEHLVPAAIWAAVPTKQRTTLQFLTQAGSAASYLLRLGFLATLSPWQGIPSPQREAQTSFPVAAAPSVSSPLFFSLPPAPGQNIFPYSGANIFPHSGGGSGFSLLDVLTEDSSDLLKSECGLFLPPSAALRFWGKPPFPLPIVNSFNTRFSTGPVLSLLPTPRVFSAF